MKWYLSGLKNYAVFTGRATRQEYWMYILFNLIFLFAAVGLDVGLKTFPVLYFVYAIATFLPGLGLAIRRLHDVGKSGWFFLILCIPIIGAIWFLVLVCSDGIPGDNAYGPSPKAALNVSAV